MKYLNFLESIYFLEKNKINCEKTYIIKNKNDLIKFKNYPYVLKLSSSLLHKTDQNAVYTNLNTQKELNKAFTNLNKILKNNKIEGSIVLQKQVKGLELIIGISRDPQFGKTILFGEGGIFTEKLDDSSLRVLPVSKKEISNMIKETKVYNILKGARNKKYDLDLLEDLIYKISKLAIKEDIKDLDLNPVIINQKGIHIVDARVGL
jgi:acyl-CoA synthetase (NDP forming)